MWKQGGDVINCRFWFNLAFLFVLLVFPRADLVVARRSASRREMTRTDAEWRGMTRNLEIVPNDRKSTKYPSNMHKIGPEVPSVLHYVQLGSFNIYLFPSPFRGMGQNIRLSLFPPLSAGPICPELSGKILPISRYIGYVWFMKFQMSKQVPLSPPLFRSPPQVTSGLFGRVQRRTGPNN